MRPLLISIAIHALLLGGMVFRFPNISEGGPKNVEVSLGSAAAQPVSEAAAKTEAETEAEPKAETDQKAASVSVSAAAAASASETGFSNADPYYMHVRAKIESHLHYPASFARRRIGGSVELELRLDPNGEISGLRLSKSSGNSELDQWVLDSVQKTAPFESFPGSSPRTLRLPVSFLTR